MNIILKLKLAKFKQLVAPIYKERMELLKRTAKENGDAEPQEPFPDDAPLCPGKTPGRTA